MVDLLRSTSPLQVDDKDDTEHGSDEYTSNKETEMVDLLRSTSFLQVDDKDDTEHGSDEYSCNKETKRLDDTDDIENGSDEYSSRKETKTQDHQDYIFVAAIHLGTADSNWACSFKHVYMRNPENIRVRSWNGQNISYKAPTTILIREDGKTLDKFGYEAEDKYAEFASNDDSKLHTWYYFKRFKMLLHDRKIRRDITLQSENGKVLPALTVFALTIEYLKNDLLEDVGMQEMDDLDKRLIRWVLTVPDIWDESSKQFMREAAVTAGIPSNQLTLAFETEVASLYCIRMHLVSTFNGEACPLVPGEKFILIDAGSNTIDIVGYEVISDGSLNEVYRSNGCASGGTEVDKEYFAFLKDFFGRSVFENFKRQHMDDYLYLCREFEQKKRTIEPQRNWKVTIRVPISLNELFGKQNEQNLAASLKSRGKWSGSVNLFPDKMRVDTDVIKRFYADELKKTRDHLQLLFSGDAFKNVNIIMMVGGFSDSKMLQEMVCNLFPKKKVIVPKEAGLAVLKGAILFGHDPAMIGQRVCTFSYGVKTSVKFVQGKHREDKK